MTDLFTSDLHIGHANIIKYCNRPFTSVDEMNETLLKNWNNKVKPGDNVYCVGDIALCRPEQAVEWLRQANGNKFLVEGNHDRGCLKDRAFRECFIWISPLREIKIPDPDVKDYGEQRITLCHYSMNVWNKSHHGAWQLFGHSHGTLPENPTSRSMDVGVDARNYAPISYQEVKEIMKTKTWISVDHHTGYRE